MIGFFYAGYLLVNNIAYSYWDMICANQVDDNLGFEQDSNPLTPMSTKQEECLPSSSKMQQALI